MSPATGACCAAPRVSCLLSSQTAAGFHRPLDTSLSSKKGRTRSCGRAPCVYVDSIGQRRVWNVIFSLNIASEEAGNPFQYFSLENPMDGGALAGYSP